VVPILFVLSPSLLLYGSPLEVTLAGVTGIAGIWMTSAGIAGYLVGPLTAITRTALGFGGLALLIPAQAFPGAWILESGGAVLCLLLVVREIKGRGTSLS
jgi:TRAP-type uncharacterized transport system fused permease subunit